MVITEQTSEERLHRLSLLIAEYKVFKETGKLDSTSEETIRTWLNELLAIFDWDVKDTSQILQEKVLSKAEQEKLKKKDSVNIRPDYTFKLAKQSLTFLDAKDISIDIETNKSASYQIRSYGWSLAAPCAFLSNFEQFAIHDCTFVPDENQDPELGRRYIAMDDYIANFDLLEAHLLKSNIYSGKLNEMYSNTFTDNPLIIKKTPELKFAQQLSDFRLELAQNIYANNKAYFNHNSENLSYVVQVIINRILFIRICEARKIEDEGLLLSYRESGFWESFKQSSYFDFYNHYDGSLFERIDSIQKLKVDNELFNSFLDILYYPSPYRFNVIPTKLLSDIYEVFLSKKLSIINEEVKDEIKDEYSKTKGAVSTPSFIVNEVIQKTIQRNKIIDEGIQKLFDLKIIDIATGSGVFAIGVYDFLEDIFKELYQKEAVPEYDKYFTRTETGIILNILGKKSLIENCIFGVDIDPEAVEVTKMSLSLKIIDSDEYAELYAEMGIYGNKILNGIGNNIRCGNSLVDETILELYSDLENDEEELLRINIFNWQEEFEGVFDKNNGFNYIVGNPPYVEVKNYNVNLPHMHKFIKEKYNSATNGKIDLAIPFIEKALSLLKADGRLGFVIQKRFFKTEYGKKIRELISSANSISLISDFEANNIFKDRVTYIAILILNKVPSPYFKYKFFDNNIETLPAQLRETSIDDYQEIPSSIITENPWNFENVFLLKLKEKLKSLGQFSDYVKVKVGLQALWDKAYHIRIESITNGMLKGKSHIDSDIEIELNACRPLLANERFFPFRNDSTNLYILFPYKINNGTSEGILFSDFEKLYPKAFEYLRKHETTIKKNVEHFEDDQHWHLYTRANNHGFTSPKILVPMTMLDPCASVTTSNTIYCDNANMFFLDVPNKDLLFLYAIAAIVNSTIFSVLARSIANPQAKGYFKFNRQFLNPVPFPVQFFTDEDNSSRVIALGKIALKIEKTQEKYIHGSPTQKRTYERILKKLWEEVDRIVFNLYNLSEDETSYFVNIGRNQDRIQSLNY